MNSDTPEGWFHGGVTVGEVGEEAILGLFVAPTPMPWLRVPNGDDAAVLDPEQQAVVISVDAVLEHQHFERSWLSPAQLGARALYVSASDLAAMGVVPRWCLTSLQVPSTLSFQALSDLARGMQSTYDEEGITVIGGNVTRADSLGLHLTVGGFATHGQSTITRSGARDGDFLWLTGAPGRAAAGRALLASPHHRNPEALALMDSWRCPPQRWALASRLREECSLHAAIDLSDGLWMDAQRMGKASDVTMTLDLDALGLDEDLEWAGKALGQRPFSWVLAGGEDYEVLLAAPELPPAWAQRQGVKVVGSVRAGAPCVEFLRDGVQWKPDFPISGWDPFTRTRSS